MGGEDTEGILEGSLMKRIQPQHVGFVCKDNNKDDGRKSCSIATNIHTQLNKTTTIIIDEGEN